MTSTLILDVDGPIDPSLANGFFPDVAAPMYAWYEMDGDVPTSLRNLANPGLPALAIGAVTAEVDGLQFLGRAGYLDTQVIDPGEKQIFAVVRAPDQITPPYGQVMLASTSTAAPSGFDFSLVTSAAVTATTTAGSTTLTAVAGALVVGQAVVGAGIPAGTTLTSISGSTAVMTAAATASASGVSITGAKLNGSISYDNTSNNGGKVFISINTTAASLPTPASYNLVMYRYQAGVGQRTRNFTTGYVLERGATVPIITNSNTIKIGYGQSASFEARARLRRWAMFGALSLSDEEAMAQLIRDQLAALPTPIIV